MLELAQLYLTLDEIDACKDQCRKILKNDEFNEEATLVCFVSLPTQAVVKRTHIRTQKLLFVFAFR